MSKPKLIYPRDLQGREFATAATASNSTASSIDLATLRDAMEKIRGLQAATDVIDRFLLTEAEYLQLRASPEIQKGQNEVDAFGMTGLWIEVYPDVASRNRRLAENLLSDKPLRMGYINDLCPPVP